MDVIKTSPYREGAPDPDRAVLVGDFFIEATSHSGFRELHVINLSTATGWTACADGREEIKRIAASDQLIAVWTSSYRITLTSFELNLRGL